MTVIREIAAEIDEFVAGFMVVQLQRSRMPPTNTAILMLRHLADVIALIDRARAAELLRCMAQIIEHGVEHPARERARALAREVTLIAITEESVRS